MIGYAVRAVLLASTAVAVAAPAVDVASLTRPGTISFEHPLVSPTPTLPPTRTDDPARTAAPTRTPEPTRTPGLTRAPEPTRTAEPTRSSTPTPIVTPFPSVKPSHTAEPTLSPDKKYEYLVELCVARRDAEAAEKCVKALTYLGVSVADLRAKIDAHLEEIARLQQKPNAAPAKTELQIWIAKCLDSRELYGPECYRAWELSGVSSEQFDRKITAEWEARKARGG